MRGHRGFVLVLLLLAASGAGVLLGAVEPGVSLSSVLEVWGDALRDTDQFGLRFTRASDREEIELGRKLATQATTWFRGSPQQTKYVSAIGDTLRPYLRRTGIPYEFHVIESRQINAFALPGGHVFIMTGMLDFLQSEAELAAILGHEMSHVDLRHCIERFQYELAMKKIGMPDFGRLTEVARNVLTVGYQKYQEVEADAQGVRMSIQAGYEPGAGAAVFDRLNERFGRNVAAAAKTPAGEAIRALDVAMGSYLQSHPPSEERTLRLKRLELANRGRLSGRGFYVGKENYRLKIPRAEREFPGERRSANELKPMVFPQVATPTSAPTGRPAPSMGAPTAPQPAVPPRDYDREIQDDDQRIRLKRDDARASSGGGSGLCKKRGVRPSDPGLRPGAPAEPELRRGLL